MNNFFDMLTVVKQKQFLNAFTILANDTSIQHRIAGIATRKGTKPKELTQSDKLALRAGMSKMAEQFKDLADLPDDKLFERSVKDAD